MAIYVIGIVVSISLYLAIMNCVIEILGTN